MVRVSGILLPLQAKTAGPAAQVRPLVSIQPYAQSVEKIDRPYLDGDLFGHAGAIDIRDAFAALRDHARHHPVLHDQIHQKERRDNVEPPVLVEMTARSCVSITGSSAAYLTHDNPPINLFHINDRFC